MFTLYGVPFSAHTRKVILAAYLKALDFKLEPVVPLNPPEGWDALSPIGKIPAMRDGDFVLSDSSVICAYLERKYPQQPLYPQGAEDFARALWLVRRIRHGAERRSGGRDEPVPGLRRARRMRGVWR